MAIEHRTKFWPAYLPVEEDRVFIFERSKNAQLVVYTAKYADRGQRLLDPKNPLDINWQSFGWTAQPTSNPTGVVERKMAWGYSHKAVEGLPLASYGSQFNVTLNALPSRAAQLYFDAKGRLILQTTINGVASRLWKRLPTGYARPKRSLSTLGVLGRVLRVGKEAKRFNSTGSP
ncbi:hypothetical protein P43SY_003665 [Pythium insidiosum]|uniref:DUF4833 domain-containing protein n=1 Tax=Pythium insidiosum TaxID=114742 RepID=A0AAD5LR78_PYTIN|nr:hypothetical protein P43SY_003665 [Pythium insidiosum]